MSVVSKSELARQMRAASPDLSIGQIARILQLHKRTVSVALRPLEERRAIQARNRQRDSYKRAQAAYVTRERESKPIPTHCACGRAIQQSGRGRPRIYCDTCRSPAKHTEREPRTECVGCGASLTQGSTKPRKWCSDKCRKVTLYSSRCVDCGAVCNVDGSVKDASKRCVSCSKLNQKRLDSRRARSHHNGRVWTDAAIIDVLRSVAADGVLTGPMYDAAYDSCTTPMPARITIVKRFGKWNYALHAAGLPFYDRRDYTGSLTRTGALLAIEDCAAEIGWLPTLNDYSEWAKRTGSPSEGSIRNLFGGSWMNAIDAVRWTPGHTEEAA